MSWTEQNNKLSKEFVFKNFSQAFAFMTQVALLAEKADHHPEWKNVWNKVWIDLCTHSEGSTVTSKDRELANAIDTVYRP